ncbi:unnamed protein product [Brassica napus]|uniref:(rape) hypothetical protein n=1 Tax=Brassica napus TaxID=3708 RepID=A0A816PRN6_BRANA|nr:unnamed protein product [Brassica napus]
MVNLLEAAYPSRFSPISVFTLHLVELKGRAHAHQGTLMAQHFTAAAPFSSINDDICTLALDKKAALIVIPFHKQYAIDGNVDHANSAIRSINLNVHTWRNVAVIFIEGRDDAEALAFCMRIAEHPEVSVTMIHFIHMSSLYLNQQAGEENEYSEGHLINDFKNFSLNKPKIHYREEIMRDGVQTTQVIRALGDTYDMVVVGRDHDLDSSVLYGLTDWSECPELGVIGDMFASSDFHFSVLVVHQQEGESLGMDDSYKLPDSPPRIVDPRVHPRFSVEEGFTSIDLHNNR